MQVNEDIAQDEDMDADGTYYGGSTTDGGPSAENVWEEDDGSSLEGLNDLEEKIVNFELSETSDSARRPEATTTSVEQKQEEASMANVYSDDNSVPSRDKDDDNEDFYKPLVDQVPKTKLTSEHSGSLAVLADNTESVTKHDEDTDGILTGGTPTDRDHEDGAENGWDDSESLDGLTEDAAFGQLEKESTPEVNVAEEQAAKVVVENTPTEEKLDEASVVKGGASLAAVESTDNSCPSRVHDSDEV